MTHCPAGEAACAAADSVAIPTTSTPAQLATWRSDVSSDVTSVSQMSQRSSSASTAAFRDSMNRDVVAAVSQLISELQAMLPDDDSRGGRSCLARQSERRQSVGNDATTGQVERGSQPSSPAAAAGVRPQSAGLVNQHPAPDRPAPEPGREHHVQLQQTSQQPQPQPLDLQACNGLCLVFANFSSFLPNPDCMSGNHPGGELDHRHRAGQIRDTAAAVGRLFSGRLEFTVLIHWNKSRYETLQLLRQAAAAMSEAGRDCCFAFFLGRGGPGHFVAACGGRVTLTDILATLAVGQRARLPVFVLGEITEDAAAAAETPQQQLQKNLPSDQLLLWTLGAPQVTDMVVDQLARSHLSGDSGGGCYGRDVASTMAGVAEWLRRRGKDGETGCWSRFISKLGRLVYLASPDCI